MGEMQRWRISRSTSGRWTSTPPILPRSSTPMVMSSGLRCASSQWRRKQMAKSPYVHENLAADDDEILRDGGTHRVPMMMRDAAARSFGHNDSLALHKPGQRFSVDEVARARVERAYQDSKRDLQDAWRKPDANS